MASKTSDYDQPIDVAVRAVFIRFFGWKTSSLFCTIQRHTQRLKVKIEGLQPKPTQRHTPIIPYQSSSSRGTIILTNTKENEQHNLKHTSEPWVNSLSSYIAKCVLRLSSIFVYTWMDIYSAGWLCSISYCTHHESKSNFLQMHLDICQRVQQVALVMHLTSKSKWISPKPPASKASYMWLGAKHRKLFIKGSRLVAKPRPVGMYCAPP